MANILFTSHIMQTFVHFFSVVGGEAIEKTKQVKKINGNNLIIYFYYSFISIVSNYPYNENLFTCLHLCANFRLE